VQGDEADRSGRPDSSARPSGEQRRRVLNLLRTAEGAVDAQHVASALRIHITTARFHLATLEGQGYVRRSSGSRVRGAGRPRLTYEAAPRLDYADMVSLFAAHLGGTVEERETRARRIGADLAHRVRLARPRAETSVVDLVVVTLGELGFEVNSVLNSFGTVAVRLCTCPLAEVAASAPEVVRGIQQGLIQAVVDANPQLSDGKVAVSVAPDATGGSCEISVVLRSP